MLDMKKVYFNEMDDEDYPVQFFFGYDCKNDELEKLAKTVLPAHSERPSGIELCLTMFGKDEWKLEMIVTYESEEQEWVDIIDDLSDKHADIDRHNFIEVLKNTDSELARKAYAEYEFLCKYDYQLKAVKDFMLFEEETSKTYPFAQYFHELSEIDLYKIGLACAGNTDLASIYYAIEKIVGVNPELHVKESLERASEVKPQIFRNQENDIKAFYENFGYWSNGIGELFGHGVDITEDELPEGLKHAYQNLFDIDDHNSLHYLVETKKGYGIALVNEYDTTTSESFNLSMKELFEAAESDSYAIAVCPEFQKAEIFLGEHLGFDNSHLLAVVLPADISIAEFKALGKKLDTLVYQGPKEMSLANQRKGANELLQPSVESVIQSTQKRAINSTHTDITHTKEYISER